VFARLGIRITPILILPKKNIPNGTMGTIMRLRKRYENTPNFYTLYVVKFDGFEYNDELIDQYDSNALAKLSTN